MQKNGAKALAYQDLPDFLRFLEGKGLLQRIECEVDPVLEITEITERIVKKGGPALYFSKVAGSPYPLVINTFGTMERMALALGVESLNQVRERIQQYLDLLHPTSISLLEKLAALPKAAELALILPKTIKKAPCQEVVEREPDLSTLPILQCWPQDGGRFITLPLVFTKDPLTGRRNCGMYRMQVFDARTTGMHWHIHKDGARHFAKSQEAGRIPVAVALGADPATIYAATAPLPPDLDEMILAGFLRHKPVEMVKCKTVDLEVPAHAEFILEGYVDGTERRREGPFGDHTGYYSLADEYPVFHLTCLTRKARPLYPAIVVGKPPMEDTFLGKATERIFLPFLKMLVPELVDLNLPLEGVFHNCAVVSIKKCYPGQAKKVMHALWGLNQLCLTKLLIVVDDEIDVQNLSLVWWKVFSNIDARRDLVLVDGPVDILDHASPLPGYGTKLGIDATRKGINEGHDREWPEDLAMHPRVQELVSRRWSEYALD